MNNRGFLLVETLISTCIIAVLATSMYIYVSNTITNYEKREKYDNIVDIYKVNNIKNYLYNNWNELELANSSLWDNGIKVIELPSDLKNELKASQTFLVLNNLSNINKSDIISKTDNKSFKEYIRLLSFTGETNDYRIIVRFENDTFASLILKVPS